MKNTCIICGTVGGLFCSLACRVDNVVKDMIGFEKFYAIFDDGRIFSKRKWRFMSFALSGYNKYRKVFLMSDDDSWIGRKDWWGRPRIHSVHRLVLEHFVGPCPVGMECHHIDHDKGNNHVSNLEWVTHSENILRSFTEGGRKGYWLGKKKEPYSDETRERMAEKKRKPIRWGGMEFKSIGHAAMELGTYREKIYRYMKADKEFNGHKFI